MFINLIVGMIDNNSTLFICLLSFLRSHVKRHPQKLFLCCLFLRHLLPEPWEEAENLNSYVNTCKGINRKTVSTYRNKNRPNEMPKPWLSEIRNNSLRRVVNQGAWSLQKADTHAGALLCLLGATSSPQYRQIKSPVVPDLKTLVCPTLAFHLNEHISTVMDKAKYTY